MQKERGQKMARRPEHCCLPGSLQSIALPTYHEVQFFADIISCHLESTAPATYFALAVVLYGGNIAKKRQRGLSPAGCLEISKVLRWPRIIRFRLPRQTPVCAKNLEFFAEIVSCHHNPRTLESTVPATYFGLRCLCN